MRYIVKVSKMHKYDSATKPFGYVVYDGEDFKAAKEKLLEYAEYGGVTFESREE
jgi:hypothetical protein